MYRYPVHDKRRLSFYSPESMITAFLSFSLNKNFIDWVVNQGFKVTYQDTWKPGEGSVWWSLKKINVSSKGSPDLVDLTLMHELVEVALSQNITFAYESIDNQKKYEESIDKIARQHLKDKEFLDYIKRKLPNEYYKD